MEGNTHAQTTSFNDVLKNFCILFCRRNSSCLLKSPFLRVLKNFRRDRAPPSSSYYIGIQENFVDERIKQKYWAMIWFFKAKRGSAFLSAASIPPFVEFQKVTTERLYLPPEVSSMLASECLVDGNVFGLGSWETIIISVWNPNLRGEHFPIFVSHHLWWMSDLFFFIVPTNVTIVFNSSSANGTPVYQLSVVKFLSMPKIEETIQSVISCGLLEYWNGLSNCFATCTSMLHI